MFFVFFVFHDTLPLCFILFIWCKNMCKHTLTHIIAKKYNFCLKKQRKTMILAIFGDFRVFDMTSLWRHTRYFEFLRGGGRNPPPSGCEMGQNNPALSGLTQAHFFQKYHLEQGSSIILARVPRRICKCGPKYHKGTYFYFFFVSEHLSSATEKGVKCHTWHLCR